MSEIKREKYVYGNHEESTFFVGTLIRVTMYIDNSRKRISWPSYGAVSIDVAEEMYEALGEAIKVAKGEL